MGIQLIMYLALLCKPIGGQRLRDKQIYKSRY
jgi:hypothetical protein